MAMEALQTTKKMSRRRVVKLYNILENSLRNRIHGRSNFRDYWPIVYNLSELEEGVLIWYILDMDERGFTLRLVSMKDIANYILKSHKARHVGKF